MSFMKNFIIPILKKSKIYGLLFIYISALYLKMYNYYIEHYLFVFRIFGLFDLRSPVYFLRDPDVIKQLVVKDFDHFEDHKTFVDEKSDRLFGNSLFMLTGHRWREMRATLSPGFTGSKMRQMFEMIMECVSYMSDHFLANIDASGRIDCEMKEMFSRYSNDVIASAAFGCRVNSFEDKENDFIQAGKQFLNINKPSTMIKVFLFTIIPSSWLAPFDIQFTSKKISNFFRTMVFGTMEIREREGIYRPDMINILSNVRQGKYEKNASSEVDAVNTDGFATVEESNIGKAAVRRKWNDDEIIAQCFLFFIAGFDTTSTFLSILTYELAINPDMQKRLYEEVIEYDRLSNGKITYDNLQKMKYMDMVVSEGLRRWPPGAFTDRVCVKDYKYDDGKYKFTIEKGTSLWIAMSALHHDPNNFPNPMQFDPERFSEENRNQIKPGTYVPFGIGPRNCIGMLLKLNIINEFV